MASRSGDAEALAQLARLLSADLTALDESDLVVGAARAEAARDAPRRASGRLLAELHRRGHSWPQIARLTGLSQGTVWRRAEPFLEP